jgi:hypothetical protein
MSFEQETNVEVVKGKTLWTSIWPLFVASILMTWVLMALGGKGAMGVGGLGAVILGAILSAMFAANPVYTVGAAIKMAILPIVAFEIVVGYLFTYNPAIYQFKDLGYGDEAARSLAMRGWIIQSAIQTPVLTLAWAFVIVRKANRLVRQSAADQNAPPPVAGNELL